MSGNLNLGWKGEVDFDRNHFLEVSKVFLDNVNMFDEYGEDISKLISVMFARIYDEVYISTPQRFNKNEHQLEYYKLSFDLAEFLKTAHKEIGENRNMFENFEFVDKDLKLLYTITDNYIGMLVQKVLDIDLYDIESELRDLKLKKLIE